MRNITRIALVLFVVAAVPVCGIKLSDAARPAAQPALSVPLESLPIQNRSEVRLLSKADPGYSGNLPITRGIQFGQRGDQLIVDLEGKFSRLSGTIYSDNADIRGGAGPLGFSAGGQPFYTTASVTPSTPFKFSLDVRGMGTISIAEVFEGGIYDIVADASAGSPLPSKVTVISPASGDTFNHILHPQIHFVWQRFPGASAYLVHLWILQGTSTPITAHTPLTLAATVFHATSYTWNSQDYPAGQYDFQVLPVDGRGADIGKWSDPIGINVQEP